MRRIWKILLSLGLVLGVVIGVLIYKAREIVTEFEPYVKDQALAYLREKYDANVEIESLKFHLPAMNRLELYLNKGKGAKAGVTLNGIVLRRKDRPDDAPLLTMKRVSFRVDVGKLMDPRKVVELVEMDGVVLNVPPKGDRKFSSTEPKTADSVPVQINEIRITNAQLVIHPKDRAKKPIEVEIQSINLRTEGFDKPMKFVAALRCPKPPGQIDSTGQFGPWVREEPADTPIEGEYRFKNADLGVFSSIGGRLDSTGTYVGTISDIQAKGEAYIPKFMLKISKNPIPLRAQFQVEVDGTNGNTILKPVQAQLGKSRFVTSGAVIKHDGDKRRSIDLKVKMTAGRLEDFLKLAMKGNNTLMEGQLMLDAKIAVPPLEGKVVEKLRIDGKFDVTNAKFLKTTIQDRIDELSRKGQGQPKNEGIDEVVSRLFGAFILDDKAVEFSRLSFGVTGALIDLAGRYDLDLETVDFRGTMRLDAKVSQTQSGIKRWVLKPIDPIFSKNGAGTFIKIKIAGTRDKPAFGRDKD
jgi:hypothetical protein